MPYLFEQLYDPRKQPLGGEPDTRQAVRDQVQRLAWSSSTPAGDGWANVVPFGAPSPVEIGLDGEHGVARYAESFRRLIEQHEPRLLDAGVAVLRTGRTLDPYSLLVSGTLAAANGQETFSFTVDLPEG